MTNKRKPAVAVRSTWMRMAAGLAALLALCLNAFSQTTCLGPVIGIPANPTAPVWWQAPSGGGGCGSATPPPGCAYYQSQDDPRWVGAGAITFGDGVSSNVEFRGLQDASSVYLSWRLSN